MAASDPPRVWHRYLSETDVAHLAKTSRPRPFPGLGAQPAVLSLDNYRGAIGDEPEPLMTSVERWPASTGLAGWEALEHISTLLASARGARVPVIHATGLAAEESGIASWRSSRGTSPVSADAADRHRRRYDIVDPASPHPGEVVLRKTAPSAFFATPLLSHLVGTRVDTLIVCGQTASGCVRATVVDGCSYRFRMIVVEDCVYDRHEVSRAISLFDMDQKYGHVVSLGTVLDQLRDLSGTD